MPQPGKILDAAIQVIPNASLRRYWVEIGADDRWIYSEAWVRDEKPEVTASTFSNLTLDEFSTEQGMRLRVDMLRNASVVIVAPGFASGFGSDLRSALASAEKYPTMGCHEYILAQESLRPRVICATKLSGPSEVEIDGRRMKVRLLGSTDDKGIVIVDGTGGDRLYGNRFHLLSRSRLEDSPSGTAIEFVVANVSRGRSDSGQPIVESELVGIIR